ncbi:uncharacterized protein TNCV_1808351 [Trichonephila clavipes]|nr:uncharacterized protein TNCV_1808351 [Trichonephila clavipes]
MFQSLFHVKRFSLFLNLFENFCCRGGNDKFKFFTAWRYSKYPSRRSPLVWLVEGKERWEAPDLLKVVYPQNWSGTEPNSRVPCMVLKATANDKGKKLALCRDEFRGPRSDTVRQVASEAKTEILFCTF